MKDKIKILAWLCIYLIALEACNNTNQSLDKVIQITATLEYPIKAELGEGAFWNHQTQELYWVDILKKKVHIYSPSSNLNRSYTTESLVGTVVPIDQNKCLIAQEDGAYTLDLRTGDLKLFSSIEAGISRNRLNDGKTDAAGRFWVGSMNLEQTEASGKLYMVNEGGTVKTMLDSITISNGIVWNKDANTMYYIDTPTGIIRAFDYNNETGDISNERIAVSIPDSLGFPDGMSIDEEDKLWVGMWNGNSVIRFDPLDGSVMSKLIVPAHNVTSCAFGGPNLDTLYITTARVDMTDQELAEFPNAGSIFKAVPGVKGVVSKHFNIKK